MELPIQVGLQGRGEWNVKNKLWALTWLAAAIVLGLSGRAFAQGQPAQGGQYTPPPPPKTKIAVVNIMRVVKMS